MTHDYRVAATALAAIGASLALTSCGHPDKHLAANRPTPRVSYETPVMPARPATPPAATEASEAVWGVRAGLNVAALSCRGQGRRPVAGAYATMLNRHRELLASAYRREQGGRGVQAFDRQQTRVYNTFANQASPARFCTAASSIAQRANGLNSAAFAMVAPRLLGELKASLH